LGGGWGVGVVGWVVGGYGLELSSMGVMGLSCHTCALASMT
jgi:hypothetical protein